jgi:hypothetical protein
MVRCGVHLSNLALGSFTLSLRLVEVVSFHKKNKLEVKRGASAVSNAGGLSVGR